MRKAAATAASTRDVSSVDDSDDEFIVKVEADDHDPKVETTPPTSPAANAKTSTRSPGTPQAFIRVNVFRKDGVVMMAAIYKAYPVKDIIKGLAGSPVQFNSVHEAYPQVKEKGLIYCFYNKEGTDSYIESPPGFECNNCWIVGVQSVGPGGYKKLLNLMAKFIEMVNEEGLRESSTLKGNEAVMGKVVEVDDLNEVAA